MRITLDKDMETNRRHVHIEIDDEWIVDHCENHPQADEIAKTTQQAKALIETAVLAAMGLKLREGYHPAYKMKRADGIKPSTDKNCKTCWQKIPAHDIDPNNTGECENCRAL